MRLLVIIASYPPHQVGGYEIRCKDVVDGLLARGHEALILTMHCPTKKCDLHDNEGSIIRILHQKEVSKNFFKQIANDIRDIKFINTKVREYSPDIIYLWGIQNISNAILPYFSNLNKPIVFDEGGSGLIYLTKIYKRGLYFYQTKKFIIKNKIKEWVYILAKILSSGLITPDWAWPKEMNVYYNSVSAMNYSKECGVVADKARVIYPGIEIERFPFHEREKIDDPVRILIPGRIKQEKGTKDAIALVQELLKRNVSSVLKIVGGVQSAEYFENINRDIRNNGLQSVISYSPMVSQNELAKDYQDSDICFFPTYFKTGLSRVPLEAMASGCIVISYGNEGSKEVIQNGKTGFIVNEGDIAASADIIESLISNPGIYREISLNARKKIETDHSIDHYINSIETYLQGCLSQFNKDKPIS